MLALSEPQQESVIDAISPAAAGMGKPVNFSRCRRRGFTSDETH